MSIPKSFLTGVKLAKLGFSEPHCKFTSASFAIKAGHAKASGNIKAAGVMMRNARFYESRGK